MRTRILTAALASVLLLAGCASKKDTGGGSPGGSDKLVLGASLSLTGSLAREGNLTKEGYELCRQVVNAKGGVPVGDKKLTLEIEFQDDTSKPDTAGQLIDSYNGKGIRLILGPYVSATTEAAAAVIERNNQVMAEGAGADDKIFTKGYKRTFAVLSPAKSYVASMVQAINDLANPKPKTIAFISADDGFSKTAAEGGVARAKELGLNPQAFGETVAPPTPDFVKTLAASAEGVLGSSQWTTTTAGSDKYFGSASDYAKTFAAQFGGRQPQYHGAEATAACLAMVLAVEKAGSIEPDKVRDALAALGFSLVWGVMNVVNLAHGAFVLCGAYLAYVLNSAFGLDPFLSMVPAAAVLFVIGYALQRGLVNLIVNAPIFLTLLLTFGLELVIVNTLILGFTADYRSIPTGYAERSLILPLDVRLPLGRLIAALLAVAIALGLGFVMRTTRTGLSILATGMDRGAARLMGIKAAHVYALTFGIAAGLAGAAGAGVGAVTTFSPADATRFTLFSFVAAVLGGLGNMSGALYGGLLLGLVEAWGGQLLPGTLVNAVAFAVLVVVLAIRPQGIAGRAFYAARVEV